ncbi:SDR family NAD(P)-dependent oxidoreductase [Magnetospirillum sulfuroxidans]|uniref:SDR family oxidoreductase n=1 Tax=Magnetospirillum sulfuroxidans TaxID=611300 RepID=A0ABS5IAM6_9PROT|nr:SDR family NAD(P)-dependent oxidoreductase [Magnetospirillum sulfuroxidans]MBR9971359.1 SDR family oxidoreductase [Magnetospirillum sulfuroxidans]
MQGKVAVVTGAGRGIGLAVARLLAARDATVVRTGLGQEDGDDYFQADMGKSDQVAALYRHVHKRFGRLDILVNNAGMLGDARLGMIADEMMGRVIDVNLKGVIVNIQAASKLMRRSGGGAIVSVSSIIGLRGNEGQVVYAATKAGIVGVTLSAAKELAADHIRVNAVAPGFIATDMIAHLDAETTAQRLAAIPLGRAGTADDVAEVIVFLCSDAARYVTGQVIGVDGGMVL